MGPGQVFRNIFFQFRSKTDFDFHNIFDMLVKKSALDLQFHSIRHLNT
jgi:hypothetical protein